MAMKITLHEARAWAWWLLAAMTVIGVFWYFRFVPLNSEQNAMIWDRLRQRHCMRWANGIQLCWQQPDSLMVVLRPDQDSSRPENRLRR